MRRRLLVLLSASVLLALFIPATAAAAGWVVKSPSGQRLGKVVRVSKGVCDLYDAAGVHCGWVQWRSGDSDWMAVWGYDTDGGLRKMATVDKGSSGGTSRATGNLGTAATLFERPADGS